MRVMIVLCDKLTTNKIYCDSKQNQKYDDAIIEYVFQQTYFIEVSFKDEHLLEKC